MHENTPAQKMGGWGGMPEVMYDYRAYLREAHSTKRKQASTPRNKEGRKRETWEGWHVGGRQKAQQQ